MIKKMYQETNAESVKKDLGRSTNIGQAKLKKISVEKCSEGILSGINNIV